MVRGVLGNFEGRRWRELLLSSVNRAYRPNGRNYLSEKVTTE
jgi:hypothetical protein